MREVEINGHKWKAIPNVLYPASYYQAVDDIRTKKYGPNTELSVYRSLSMKDPFFFGYFVMGIETLNHPWLIARCMEMRNAPASHVLYLWAREHYKAVDVNEPVPTPSGWRPHGELDVGDSVFGPDGSVRKVVGRTEVFTNADCYRVTFSDGYEVTVSGDHLWKVGKKSRRRISGTKNRRHYRDYQVLNTRTLAQHPHALDNRYSVDLIEPLRYDEKQLPIHPYVLGAWLGDGTSASSHITSNDPEMMDYIRSLGYEVKKCVPKYLYLVRGLQPILKEIGVYQNKHIPEDYLRASVEQRFELLRGLMDTDGCCDTRGTATFCNINETLARQLFEVAGSLGLSPHMRKHYSTFRGKLYEFFQVSFQAYKAQSVFRLQRKLARGKDGTRPGKGKYIVKVEPVPTIPVSCIQVDAADGLYVIGKNFTTTHNSTLITKIKAMQRLLCNPEERIGLFSYSRPIARGFLRTIKHVFETSEILKACFPDVLWQNPEKDAPKWSEEDGIVLRRKGYYGEASLEAWGLLEGMPTSKHFSGRIYDDVETDVTTSSPEVMEKLVQAFELSQNLGTAEGWHYVVGTTYHHNGLLQRLKEKKAPDGQKIYEVSLRPATEDGTPNGKPVLLSERRMAELKANPRTFYPQQLLDPTPKGTAVLEPALLKEIMPGELPRNLFKFMLIDPAGVDRNREGDAWAMGVIGVEPFINDLGASNIYLLDLVLQPLDEVKAIDEVVSMYLRNGRILKLGVEKVAMNSTEIHVANALRAKGRLITQDAGNLVLLRPAGRSKQERIERALPWPLAQGKIHIVSTIPKAYKDRFRTEMERFPFWHDDGIDMLSYIYDVITEYRFPRHSSGETEEALKRDGWDEAFDKHGRASDALNWMVC